MKKVIMKKLVKALRSGDYLQGTHRLAKVDGYGEHRFCCLGVLCNIMQEETGKLKVTKLKHMEYAFNTITGVLPDAVMEWSGIKDANGVIKYKNGKSNSLTALNDNGKSFNQIADIIEKNYEVLQSKRLRTSVGYTYTDETQEVA